MQICGFSVTCLIDFVDFFHESDSGEAFGKLSHDSDLFYR